MGSCSSCLGTSPVRRCRIGCWVRERQSSADPMHRWKVTVLAICVTFRFFQITSRTNDVNSKFLDAQQSSIASGSSGSSETRLSPTPSRKNKRLLVQAEKIQDQTFEQLENETSFTKSTTKAISTDSASETATTAASTTSTTTSATTSTTTSWRSNSVTTFDVSGSEFVKNRRASVSSTTSDISNRRRRLIDFWMLGQQKTRQQLAAIRSFRVAPFLHSHNRAQTIDPKVREDIGDMVVKNDAEAAVWQNTIEKALRRKLNFKLHSGDMILTMYDELPKEQNIAKKNQSIGHSLIRQQRKSGRKSSAINRNRKRKKEEKPCHVSSSAPIIIVSSYD